MKKFFTLIVFLLLFSSPIYAQDDVRGELNQIESERLSRIESQLLLNIPEISDNPNHIITFQDPSGNGVFLEIDAQGFNQISSPYTLPSLGLGKHILTFKFSDNQNTEQILEKPFTVIPRVPILNPPTVSENKITVSGTSIQNSKVDIFLTSGTFNKQAFVDVDENGNWEYTLEEEIQEGTYTIVATTRRNGFSSYYSEPMVFIADDEASISTSIRDITKKISFSFKNLDFKNPSSIVQTLRENTDLILAFLAFFFLGLVVAFLIVMILNKTSQKKSRKVLQELLRRKTDEGTSLKDKFEKSKENPEEKIEDVKVEEKKEEEEDAVSITKEEFLKRFKDFDPDEDDGTEKKQKKSIKISLTSKD